MSSSAVAGGPAVASPAAASSSSAPAPSTSLGAYSRFSRSWVLPGTLACTAVGSCLGGALSAWYHRPMWTSTWNVGSKFGMASLAYLGTLAAISDITPAEHRQQRLATHAATGAISGGMFGGLTGKLPGAIRGTMIGAVVAVPVWLLMEGRHQIKFTQRVPTAEKKVSAAETRRQLQDSAR